jgi:hypothetical protein
VTPERKPIGYLMGLPIYEVEPGELPDPGPLAFCELTPEIAKRAMEQIAADSLCRNIQSPKEDVQC